ncbi:uncharacterized protein Z519_04137 [Cladophialophora bantiana CBS 173.52]|uniref:Uncharacterized protein n=1 Tax=Cladophialophora bantiana (strain ATCC 10958 / CBS 173.52 / CDC B-1940 / NIH 8579) TaxID=1442370 RepID=A0A0D2GAF4_CLAB1|nr:uncharacterized protein Z519_04137 [Cladophialophora bantiana CBS 173.52]KIW95552.1 hypothetical protein Z519_04137 [Cladophialophora bantiana CBS 173.52]
MARTRTTDNRRKVSESEQREFESINQQRQQQQQQLFEFDEHEQFQHEWHGAVRRFEIFKSTTLGLVCPQNLDLSVVDVDAGIVHRGSPDDLSTLPTSRHEPVFVTSDMKWWKQKPFLPPSFQIFPGVAHQRHPQHKWLRGREVPPLGSEVTRPPLTPPHETVSHILANPSADPVDVLTRTNSKKSSTNFKKDEPYPLAEIKYQGWQGFTRMSISLTVYNITPDMHHSPPAPQELHHTIPDIRSQYTIARCGWKREYILTGSSLSLPGYKWHSPPSHNSQVLSMPAVDDGFDLANGNLLLEDSKGTLVAVYKQRRDHEVLGALTVFLANVVGGPSVGNHMNGSGNGHGHGHGNGNIGHREERIPLEVVVASCLAVVVYERVGWQNLLGH